VLEATAFTNNEWVHAKKPNNQPLGLVNGTKYFFKVKATNYAEIQSEEKQSDGITIDTSMKPSECANGVKDASEIDVDCGNRCAACDTGKKCISNNDCRSLFCRSGTCAAPSCTDSIKNQNEGDIDCGGECSKCSENKQCNQNNDCSTGLCIVGKCRPQQLCFDNTFTPGESDIDCGGPCPTKCSERKHCNANEDCARGLSCSESSCRRTEDSSTQSPTNTDSDSDGMPDQWEIENGLDPNDASDADMDNDNDGLTNREEFEAYNAFGTSTDPNNPDTDNDGANDKQEIDSGTNPTDPADFPKSGIGTIIMFIFGILIMASCFAYLAYRMMSKKKEGFEIQNFQTRQQSGQPQTRVQPSIQSQAPAQKPRVTAASNLFRKREDDKEKERQKLFEAFDDNQKKPK
jgi:hypothetical protein